MKILNCEQGSDAWIKARISLPTASNFDKLITKTGKPSASADRYLARLAAEWVLGVSLDEYVSQFMERGTEMEAEARALYQFQHDVVVERVGLCLRDDERAGASPDALVGTDGLLEIKCPSAEVHMMYLLGGPPEDYFTQVMGQLYITGRKWCDLYCYHPTLPCVVKRYERDEKYIGLLAVEVDRFVARLESAKLKLVDAKADCAAREVDEELPAALA